MGGLVPPGSTDAPGGRETNQGEVRDPGSMLERSRGFPPGGGTLKSNGRFRLTDMQRRLDNDGTKVLKYHVSGRNPQARHRSDKPNP